MLISDLDFELPAELIAQEPPERRDSSRMLVVDRGTNSFVDGNFADLHNFLRRDDLLVLNNTRVFPARLMGRTATGANVEIFLIRAIGDGIWETLARPGRRLQVGKAITFGERLSCEVAEKMDDGKVSVRFESRGSFFDVLDEIGKTPLPPYIKRDTNAADKDRDRYQTVFAKKRGAIAAPTAGLHFTPAVIDALRADGVDVAEVTLHVGYGTFEPVRVDDLSEHRVADEAYEISEPAAAALNSARSAGRRIVAVGTTTTRALESNIRTFGSFTAGEHSAGLTVTPGYRFETVDAVLTNFHLPRSSLLVLTSTFGGRELIMKAYRHAVAARYRFYSYGDCMLIV